MKSKKLDPTSSSPSRLQFAFSAAAPRRPRPQQRSLPLAASGGGLKEWSPPEEGGVFPSRAPPSELDLGGRSLESEAVPRRRPPPEFSPPDPAPLPRVLPERERPEEEEGGEEEEEKIPPCLPSEPPSEPEELPWREPEPVPEPEPEHEEERAVEP